MTSLPPYLPPQLWYVVFGPAKDVPDTARLRWTWRLALRAIRLLPDEYQHCWAFTQTIYGWLVFNPGLDGLAVAEVPAIDPAMQHLMAGDMPGCTLLRVQESRNVRLRLGWPVTCATQVAGLLADGGFRGVLPGQLYRFLINHQQAEIVYG